jgi:hypothetical protein
MHLFAALTSDTTCWLALPVIASVTAVSDIMVSIDACAAAVGVSVKQL